MDYMAVFCRVSGIFFRKQIDFMSFMAISHAFLTNIFTIFDKISVEWFTFGPEVTRNEQEKIQIRS